MKHNFISKRYWNSISTPMGESSNLTNLYEDLIDFSIGDPDITTDERIIKAAFKDAKNGHTHYTNSYGDLDLRKEICKYYNEEFNHNVKEEEIIIAAGACYAMWLVLEAILDDGDEVIIPAPYFTPYVQQVELARGKPVILNTYEEEEFQIDIEKFKKLITNRTKAIIINTPNNPTGTCFTKKTLENIAKIAIEYDLIVISDDIYTLFSFEQSFIPIASLPKMKERTITLGSFSKDYAMTGWRLGYIIAPSFIINILKDINENSLYTAPSISQRAGIHALRMRKEIQPDILNEYKKRIYYAYERINQLKNISVMSPRGTIYLFPNIKKTKLSSIEVADKILKEAHVLVIPGIAFGHCGEGYLRIAVTVGMDKLKEAFDRISKMTIFSK
jgi:aspartate/methionine/tyrosine aminotransferase